MCTYKHLYSHILLFTFSITRISECRTSGLCDESSFVLSKNVKKSGNSQICPDEFFHTFYRPNITFGYISMYDLRFKKKTIYIYIESLR